MTDLFANPAMQSVALPIVTSLGVAAILGFSSPVSVRFAGLAVLAGFLAAYVVALGLPPLPPNSSGQKIAYIALLAGVASFILQTMRSTSKQRILCGLVVSLASILWIGWRKVIAPPSVNHISVLLIGIGVAVVLVATERETKDGADKTVPLLVVGLAMAGIAFFGASASISQNAGALSAALGGLLLLNWPKRRFGLDVTARLVSVIVFSGLVTQTVLFTMAPAWVLILLLPAFFADRLAQRWIKADNPRALLLRPILIAFIAAVPAVATLTAARVAAALTDLSGGY